MIKYQTWKPDTEDNLVILQAYDTVTDVFVVRGVVENGVLKVDSEADKVNIKDKEIQRYGQPQVEPNSKAKGNSSWALNVKKNAEVMPALMAIATPNELIEKTNAYGETHVELKHIPKFKNVNGVLEGNFDNIPDVARRNAYKAKFNEVNANGNNGVN